MRVAVYTSDPVGPAMAGPAIRYFEIARELGRRFSVSLLTPSNTHVRPEGVELVELPDRTPQTLTRALKPFDVVVTQLLPLDTIRAVLRARKRVIYDLYNPYMVEALAFWSVEPPTAAARWFARTTKLTQHLALATGDGFVCASERQRDVWLGVLASLGRIDSDAYARDATLRSLIDVVPYGLSSERPPPPPRRVAKGVRGGIGEDDVLLVWAGGIWNWLDPLTVIRAVAELASSRSDIKLLFLGLNHPNPDFPQMEMARRAVRLADELGVAGRSVHFNEGWVPYEERSAFLLEADVGVSAHYDILETRYAFRTRLLDHFWAGLPTITTGGDVLADLVEERALGAVVGFEDVEEWTRAIERLADDAHERAEIGRRLASIRADFAWPVVLQPLVRLVESTVRGPASASIAHALEERWLRARTSLALGGPRAMLARQARKLGSSRPRA